MGFKATDKCLQNAGDDEPIFVLRAKDKLTPALVRLWANLAESLGCPKDKVHGALSLADTIDHWQHDNGCKIPD